MASQFHYCIPKRISNISRSSERTACCPTRGIRIKQVCQYPVMLVNCWSCWSCQGTSGKCRSCQGTSGNIQSCWSTAGHARELLASVGQYGAPRSPMTCLLPSRLFHHPFHPQVFHNEPHGSQASQPLIQFMVEC